ncbi:MAG TPA: hypothetical protein VEY70_25630 [Metabacillus sp.]|nr:hypothetical protein [Metabacillus sp.]
MEKVSKVFWISIVISTLFVAWAAIAPDHLGVMMDKTKAFFLVVSVGFTSYLLHSF